MRSLWRDGCGLHTDSMPPVRPQCRLYAFTDTSLLRAPLALTCLTKPVLKLGPREASLLWVWVSMLTPGPGVQAMRGGVAWLWVQLLLRVLTAEARFSHKARVWPDKVWIGTGPAPTEPLKLQGFG